MVEIGRPQRTLIAHHHAAGLHSKLAELCSDGKTFGIFQTALGRDQPCHASLDRLFVAALDFECGEIEAVDREPQDAL